MSEDTEAEEDAPKKKSKMPLIIGLVLALAGGGGGFFAVQSGIIGGDSKETVVAETDETTKPDGPEVTFLPLDSVVISLPGNSGHSHLHFSAQLEVKPDYVTEIEAIKPRIIDVLNGYLRALEVTELEDPAALLRLRAQMLRRVQVVTGKGRVNDLLIMEFVLT